MKSISKKGKLITVNRRLVGLNSGSASQKELSISARLRLSLAAKVLAKRRWQLAKKVKCVTVGGLA
jgi:hypothetical protein